MGLAVAIISFLLSGEESADVASEAHEYITPAVVHGVPFFAPRVTVGLVVIKVVSTSPAAGYAGWSMALVLFVVVPSWGTRCT